ERQTAPLGRHHLDLEPLPDRRDHDLAAGQVKRILRDGLPDGVTGWCARLEQPVRDDHPPRQPADPHRRRGAGQQQALLRGRRLGPDQERQAAQVHPPVRNITRLIAKNLHSGVTYTGQVYGIVARAAGPIPVDFCPVGAAPRVSVMLSWWHRDVIAAGKLPLMLCFVSFVVTFVSTRTITRLIRDGRGPFRNVTAGGTHVHHSVPGIILLMIGAFTAVGGPGTLGWLSFSAIAVGIGTSLVLDEFALILHLQDVYWSG